MLPNLAILLLVAMGLFSNREALVSARPEGPSPSREYKAARIRSWEDPLSVPRASGSRDTVLNELDAIDDMKRQLRQFTSGREDTPQSEVSALRLLILPVLLPNDAREDEAEIRLRIRYAVSAALARLQYINVRPDRMSVGNLAVVSRESRKATLTVRTELFEPRNIIADNVSMPKPPEFWGEPLSDQDRAEHSGSELLEVPRPYHLVCVLWLDESQLHWRESPLAAIDEAVSKLLPAPCSTSIRVIGPNDSDLLAKWLQLSASASPDRNPDAVRILLSPRATASDTVLKMSLSTAPEATQQHLVLAQTCWQLERTIVSDDVLVKALVTELRLRKALPPETISGPTASPKASAELPFDRLIGERRLSGFDPSKLLRALQPGRPHIAIIAEWNTLYARSMARSFSAVLQSPQGTSGPLTDRRLSWSTTPLSGTEEGSFVHEYSYLRGLDGLPETAGDQTRETVARGVDGNGEADAGGPIRFLGAQGLNTAAGTSQFDYLRRLEAELRALDRRLRLTGDRLSAIGILGSDVYDKLLILRALKKSFPQAIFFTTDIDAGFLDRHEAEFTRNLVIASAHGLTTSPALQYGIPPFRDSYQTALYLTTLRALGLVRVGAKSFSPAENDSAVVAEVGITRINLLAKFVDGQMNVLAGGTEAKSNPGTLAELHPNAIDPWWAGPRRKIILACLLVAMSLCGVVLAFSHCRFVLTVLWLFATAGNIAMLMAFRPEVSFLQERGVSGVFLTLATGCFVGALVVFYRLTSADSHDPLPAESRWRRPLFTVLAIGFALVGFIGGWRVLATCLRNGAEEEPLLLTEGVSIWPTVALRALALVWCVWSVFHVESLLKEVALPLSRRANQETEPPFRHAQLAAWDRHDQHVAFKRRTRRVIRSIVGLLVVAMILSLATGMPVVPARGLASHALEKGILLMTVFAFLNLLFHVTDSMRSCQRLIEDFNTGMGRATGRSEAEAIDTIDLLASRIGRLVYLPFTAIFMLIAARNPMFDAWDWPIVMIVVFGLGLGLLIWRYLALLSSARDARSRALEFLQRRLVLLARPSSESDNEPESADYWRMLLERMRALDGAIYRPWYQSPLLGAVLIPLGGSGSLKLLEQLLRGGG